MALHYLVDGYNMLYALSSMPTGSWENKRASLLRLLADEKPQGNNAMTVVFDSREGSGDRGTFGAIAIVYTAGETADDWIIQYVRKVPNARVCVVVTDDKGLRRMIRGTGAKSSSVEEFLKTKAADSRPAPEAPRSEDADSITDEFKKKWL